MKQAIRFISKEVEPHLWEFKKLGGKTSITTYSEKDKFELFAESFAAYVMSPDELIEQAPRLYNWVEETLNAALDYL